MADEDEEAIPVWATSDGAINDGQALHQDAKVLEMEAAGKKRGFGKLFAYFGKDKKRGLEACQAGELLYLTLLISVCTRQCGLCT